MKKYKCQKCNEEWDENYCVNCSSTIDRSAIISQNKLDVSNKRQIINPVNFDKLSKPWSNRTLKSKKNDKHYKLVYGLLWKGKKDVKVIEEALHAQAYKGNISAFINEVESDIQEEIKQRINKDVKAGTILLIIGIFIAVVGSEVQRSSGFKFHFPIAFILMGLIRLIRGVIRSTKFRNR